MVDTASTTKSSRPRPKPSSRPRPRPRPSHRARATSSRRFVVGGVGLLVGVGLTVLAYHEAQTNVGQGHFAVFWAGQIVGVGALSWLGVTGTARRRVRLILLAVLALFNFLPKFVISPAHAVYFDEFGHWRQALNIVQTGQARPVNFYQPIIADYPGLEWLTVAVHAITRLDVWHSGQVVIAASHITVLLAVFGLGRMVSGSDRLAFVTAVTYSLNPSFQYFETQYSYESLGLALALCVMYCIGRARLSITALPAMRWSALAAVSGVAVVITHHLSAAFAVFGSILLVLALTRRHAGRTTPRFGAHREAEARGDSSVPNLSSRASRAALLGPLAAIGTTGGTLITWVLLVAPQTLNYIGPHVIPAFGQLVDRFTGGGSTSAAAGAGDATDATDAGSRSLFAGATIPSYEHWTAVASPFVALLLCVIGLVVLWRRPAGERLVRLNAAYIVLAALYFASLPLALTTAGSEGVHRSWAESFLGVAVLSAFALRWLAGRLPRRAFVAVTLIAGMVVMIGNVAVGEDVDYRFPGPYSFASDTKTITSATLQMTNWLNQHAAPGTGVVSDRFTNEAIEGYTRQPVVSPDQSTANFIFSLGSSRNWLRDYLRDQHFRYFVLDKRIETHDTDRALFVGYTGPESFSSKNIDKMVRVGFAKIVYNSSEYAVYRLAT